MQTPTDNFRQTRVLFYKFFIHFITQDNFLTFLPPSTVHPLALLGSHCVAIWSKPGVITHCLQMFKCARWCSQQKLENCTQLFFGLTLFRTKSLHQIDGCRQPAPLNSIPHTNGLDNVMQLYFLWFWLKCW